MQALFFTAVASAQNTKVIYVCPMAEDKEVQMSKPGNCPKCGMVLVKKTVKVNTPKAGPKKAIATKASGTPAANKQSSNPAKKTNSAPKASTSNDDLRVMLQEMKRS